VSGLRLAVRRHRTVLSIGRRVRRQGRLISALVMDMRPLLVRRPGLALTLARAVADDSADESLLPEIEALLRRRRSRGLLALRAQILGASGELTAARDTWLELAGASERARHRAEVLQGRITETDTTWLPRLPGPPEPLEPITRRRILHIAKSAAPERWSGFTIRTLHNLHAQQAAGLEPIVVTEIGWPRAASARRIEPVVEVQGVTHYRLDRGAGYDPTALPNDRRDQDNVEALAPLVRELRPAILHAHSGYRGGEHALVALALREHFGIPVVYEVRGLFESVWSPTPDAVTGSEHYQRRLAQETRILHEVDGVLAISEALADEMVERGIPRSKITLLPNGIDPDAFVPTSRDEALRSSLGLAGMFVVGYVGNLDHWREGIDVLIAAVAEVRRRGRREVAMLVVGDGNRRPELERAARRAGLGAAARFTGRVPHEAVAQYYAQMDVFANPRVEERAARLITPLKPYEAMALGVPVLVSDLPALREIVDPPNRGVTAPPGDPNRLADAILALIDDPALRGRLTHAARDWVTSERTWAANGARYRSAYEAILGPLD
jgi:glycosyltransferase involved in cell wall biosynthesis